MSYSKSNVPGICPGWGTFPTFSSLGVPRVMFYGCCSILCLLMTFNTLLAQLGLLHHVFSVSGQFGAGQFAADNSALDNSALDNSARQFVADNSAQNIILIL